MERWSLQSEFEASNTGVKIKRFILFCPSELDTVHSLLLQDFTGFYGMNLFFEGDAQPRQPRNHKFFLAVCFQEQKQTY